MKKLRLDVDSLEITTFAAVNVAVNRVDPADPAGGDSQVRTCFIDCTAACLNA